MKLCYPLLLAVSSFSCAQDSAKYRACSKNANTQQEMNSCANEEATRVDSEMIRVYKVLSSKVRDNPIATAKLKAAQRAWVTYRDAYIEAMYPAENKQAEYGSIFPMEVDLLGAKLTHQQIGALKDLLKEYDDSQQPSTRR